MDKRRIVWIIALVLYVSNTSIAQVFTFKGGDPAFDNTWEIYFNVIGRDVHQESLFSPHRNLVASTVPLCGFGFKRKYKSIALRVGYFSNKELQGALFDENGGGVNSPVFIDGPNNPSLLTVSSKSRFTKELRSGMQHYLFEQRFSLYYLIDLCFRNTLERVFFTTGNNNIGFTASTSVSLADVREQYIGAVIGIGFRYQFNHCIYMAFESSFSAGQSTIHSTTFSSVGRTNNSFAYSPAMLQIGFYLP